jgi:hypothetical protein
MKTGWHNSMRTSLEMVSLPVDGQSAILFGIAK